MAQAPLSKPVAQASAAPGNRPTPGSMSPVQAPQPDQAPLEFTPSAAPKPSAAKAEEPERENIEVLEGGHSLHPLAEEAAMLFANGREADARALLESGIKLSLGSGAESVWALLFDIYLLGDKRDAFEALALEYVVRFEKSPPSWTPLAAPPHVGAPAGPAVVALSGKLSAAILPQLEQVRRMSVRSPRVQVDLARLMDADEAGCNLLLTLLKELARAGKEIKLPGAAHLSSLLETKIDAGRRESQDTWLLLLQLYQQQGRGAPFEELALQYAITFEESPPSWEDAPPPAKAEVRDEIASLGYVLHGEITGGGSEALAGLPGYGAALAEVAIDTSALRRMDFVSAGMLLNTLSSLAAKGKSLRIRGLNAPVYALFCILGINQLATLERRK